MTKLKLIFLFVFLVVLKLIDLLITHVAVVYNNAIELNFMGYSWFSWVYTISVLIVSGFFIFKFKDKLILRILGFLFVFNIGFSVFVLYCNLGGVVYN